MMERDRRMRSRKKMFLTVIFLSIALVAGVIALIVLLNKKDEQAPFADRGLPVIDIELDGVELSEIDGGSKDIKYEGNTLNLYDDGIVREFEDVEVKGRGNGSWAQAKKPYQIKFDKKTELFGMGKAKKWYLLANALDYTYLRTETAFYLEDMLKMDCVFRGQSVELYVNGEYRGLYYVTRAMEISNDLVDLRDQYGILVELDNIYGWAEKNYRTSNGDYLVVKDVVSEEVADIAMADFLKQYNELEAAVKEKDFDKVQELIDVESFAKYFLLSEFSVNPDAYWTSFYMHKDGLDDKIHAGLGWDFDLTFGNRNWGNWMGEKFYSPNETMIRKQERLLRHENVWIDEEQFRASDILSMLMFDLTEIPEFQEEVNRIFRENMMGREEELVRMIYHKGEEIEEAAVVDGEKWNRGDFETELTAMVQWIRARYEYFERVYGDGSFIKTKAI